MSFTKNLSKKEIIIGIIAIAIFLASLIFFSIKHYNEYHIPSVYYRTYTKENGWSKWSKNGNISGDKKNDILNIEMKIKSRKSHPSIFRYVDNNWFESDKSTFKENKKMYGINIIDTAQLYRNVQICYRTYNKNDKWLKWTCKSKASGNKNETVKAVQIKVIPKNVIKYEYLEDYITDNPISKNF